MKLGPGQHARPKAADTHRATDPINTNRFAGVLANTELPSSVLCILVAALKIEIVAVLMGKMHGVSPKAGWGLTGMPKVENKDVGPTKLIELCFHWVAGL